MLDRGADVKGDGTATLTCCARERRASSCEELHHSGGQSCTIKLRGRQAPYVERSMKHLTHTHLPAKRHTRKGNGSVGTTPSSPDSTRRCVPSSAIGTLTHSYLRVKRHTREGDGSDGTTPSVPDSTRRCVQSSEIGALTHSSPRQKRHTRNARATHCAGAEKQAEACVSLAEG